MATALAEQEVLGPYVLETATQFTTVTFTDVDPTNMTSVVMSTGRCLLLARNTSPDTDAWITVFSSNDPYGRTSDITQLDIPFGTYRARIFEPRGWEQTLRGKDLLIDSENNTIEILAIPI
jgi:hypothetical protein